MFLQRHSFGLSYLRLYQPISLSSPFNLVIRVECKFKILLVFTQLLSLALQASLVSPLINIQVLSNFPKSTEEIITTGLYTLVKNFI